MTDLVAKFDLIRILECPICHDVPLPSIYNCSRGHSVCGECRKKLTKCGLCKLNFTSSRNFALESIVNASYFNCKYKDEGCKQIVIGSSFNEHADKCDFRPVICALRLRKNCDEGKEISYVDYVKHFQTFHGGTAPCLRPTSTSTAQEISFKKTEYTDEIQKDGSLKIKMMQFDDRYFLQSGLRKNGIIYRWISLIGNATDASKYQATVRITGKKQDVGSTELQWKFTLPSFRLGFEEILKTGGYACVPSDQLIFLAKTNVETKSGKQVKHLWDVDYYISKLSNE